jgi:hypothetical protein
MGFVNSDLFALLFGLNCINICLPNVIYIYFFGIKQASLKSRQWKTSTQTSEKESKINI